MSENVEVTTLFKDNGVPIPKRFKYGSRVYDIDKVNLVHSIKRGARRIIVFNVTDRGGDHVLIFDTHTLKWEMQSSYL